MNSNGKIDRKALSGMRLENEVTSPQKPDRPLTNAEEKVLTCWKAVLGKKDIGLQENFFDLGGHSLLMARLVNQMEASFQKQFSLQAFFSNTTIAEQARMASGNARLTQIANLLVCIQNERAESSLILLTYIDFRALRMHLPENLAYYIALDPQREFGKERILPVRERATLICDSIMERIPNGPVYLGGFCLQAVVALELADLLINRGREVPFLLLMSPPIFENWRHGENTMSLRNTLRRHRGELASRGFLEKAAYIARRIPSRAQSYLKRRATRKKIKKNNIPQPEESVMSILFDYQPPSFHGRSLLLLEESRPWISPCLWESCLDEGMVMERSPFHHDAFHEEESLRQIAASFLKQSGLSKPEPQKHPHPSRGARLG